MASGFEIASAVELLAPNRFRAVVPEAWQQGRGAFGGLGLGILARAMLATEAEPARSLRTFNGDICAPVLPGESIVEVTTLRRGHYLSNLDARLVQNGEVVARASATLSLPRPVDVADRAMKAPERPTFERTPVVPIRAPMGPVFAQHYEYRPTLPWTPQPDGSARVSGYVRDKIAPAHIDAPAVIALLDAYYPTLFAIEGTIRPIATVSFTAEMLADLSAIPSDAPFFHDAKMATLKGGFFVELRELWWGETLVAMNQQTFLVLK